MTMASAFEAILRAVDELRACICDRLQWAVLQARPPGPVHVLAARYEDWTADMAAAVEQAEAAALRGSAAAGRGAGPDLAASAEALLSLQATLRGLSRGFHAGLASPAAHAALEALAQRPDSRVWKAWAQDVAEAMSSCRDALEILEDRLAEAWAGWAEIACAVATEPRGQRRTRTARGGRANVG